MYTNCLRQDFIGDVATFGQSMLILLDTSRVGWRMVGVGMAGLDTTGVGGAVCPRKPEGFNATTNWMDRQEAGRT